MKRTILSPQDIAWLANTMQRRRAEFGGWRMEADPADAPPADPTGGEQKPPEPLGEGGKKALDAERDARKEAEGKAKQLEAEFGAMKAALLEAFGVKSDKGAEPTDVLQQVQSQLAQIQRENTVLALANEHGITEKADVDLLKQSNLEGDALASMAVRLKPVDSQPGTPKPDTTQGGKGPTPAPNTLPGVPRMAQAFEDAINTN